MYERNVFCCWGKQGFAVAQSIELVTPSEEVVGLIPAVPARSPLAETEVMIVLLYLC